jgi:hypothetical protein
MLDWLLAGALILLQVPDILTTNRLISRGGRELNPVMRLAMRLGKRWWWVPKLVIAGAGALILAASPDAWSRHALIALNVLYILVIVSNYRQIRRQNRMRRGGP